ncbi:AAC(3) family N-acetyltransferase [Haliangium ochraceum]|uniref:Aminoglycoside N(3)-acetyltransferase n=1 Tax=Haliangium ochraceum (strain DSM 14365 / JCM 11303 / SMP-2) TaxID=502025 RepID=D0LKX3_HALO1|nr:AAC(3) family N-acetyltransferase [Haliangium ochraceum]ACY16693.1 Aminoglycoside N(3')-acetyltransferase [Haliangium ochraceum DSM 14365]
MLDTLGEDHVVHQLRALGVRTDGVLLVHTSFRSVRPIAGGPLGLIRALRRALGPDGTLLMPTMTDGASVYDPASTPTLDMGITAELFWRQSGVLRSPHPGASFAAQGPLAAELCRAHPLSPPHGLDSPVGRAYELGGQVLLLGVGHGENTTMHLAESLARVPYSVSHPCVVLEDGRAVTVDIAESDHCCAGFAQMDAWLRARRLQREGHVGHAHARLCAAADIVAVATAKLADEPLRLLCPPGAGCTECDAAHASAAAG